MESLRVTADRRAYETPSTVEELGRLVLELKDDVRGITATVKDAITSLQTVANSMETMAEAFATLTEQITAEPDEANGLRETLGQTKNIVTANRSLLTTIKDGLQPRAEYC